ncbi:MAG TPA: CehA/McbA family metallohydrolase [Thermoplasmata archaeon]|nr:CehA/McbA family metallohydrolase [Thermoplasmata archaeon]
MTAEFRLDLHVHSDRSPDSRLSLDAIAARVRTLGLNGFALTDHNTIDGFPGLRDLQSRHPDLVVVPGVEVSTHEGHLLAYGVASLPPIRRPLEETVRWIRDHGGEAVLPHPFRFFHGVGERASQRVDIRAIETLNGQTSAHANRAAAAVAARRRLAGTGGSDGHTLAGVGRAYTTFDPVPASAEDVLESIRRATTRADGASLGVGGRLRWLLRNAALRSARGFRAI